MRRLRGVNGGGRHQTDVDCLLQLHLTILWWVGGTTGSSSDQQSTNDRKVAGSRPTKVVCITVLTGNHLGWTARCGRPPFLLPSCRKLEFRLSVLMDSDLAWSTAHTILWKCVTPRSSEMAFPWRTWLALTFLWTTKSWETGVGINNFLQWKRLKTRLIKS